MSRSGLACPPLPWPSPLQDRFDSFPKLPGLRVSSPDLSHRREDWLPLPQVSPRVAPRSLPRNLQGRLASSGDPFVCAFPPFRLGTWLPLRFPVTSGPPRSVPPPPSRVLGPSTLYGRPRSKITPQSVVAVCSCTFCNVILVACLPSPLNRSGHRRTVPFGPC